MSASSCSGATTETKQSVETGGALTGADGGAGEVLGALAPEILQVARLAYLMRALESSEPMALMPMQMEIGM